MIRKRLKKLKDKTKMLKKDNYGLLYSTELLLSIILILVIFGVIANLSDDLNEKMLSAEELSNLEKITIETSDYILNNPGVPEDWESDESINQGHVSRNIIVGLAVKNKNKQNGEFQDESSSSEKVIANIISYNKLIKLNRYYDDLINRNLFNNSLKSSIAIYPIDSDIEPMIMGDDLYLLSKDVVVVNRTVKCNYLSNYVIYNFNDFELTGINYVKEESCNHDDVPYLESHEGDENYFWLCKSFRIYKNSLENYSYYLISPSDIKSSGVWWTLESLNKTSNETKKFDEDKIELNKFFLDDLEYKFNDIYTIHFKVPKNKANSFKTVLVAIPKNMTIDLEIQNQLKYDYFRLQDVYFILKTAYK